MVSACSCSLCSAVNFKDCRLETIHLQSHGVMTDDVQLWSLQNVPAAVVSNMKDTSARVHLREFCSASSPSHHLTRKIHLAMLIGLLKISSVDMLVKASPTMNVHHSAWHCL